MSKGYFHRKSNLRTPRKKILIICEGEKTEINYFNGFKTRYSGVEIIPLHGGCTDAENIIRFAKKQIKELSINPQEGDSVWCVFDVDDKEETKISNAVAMARNNSIEIILSNPCIELWFLLHYKNIQSQKDRTEIVTELKIYIPHYEKNMATIYALTIPNVQIAITRCKQLNTTHITANTTLISRDSNPSSQIFKLVEKLLSTNQTITN